MAARDKVSGVRQRLTSRWERSLVERGASTPIYYPAQAGAQLATSAIAASSTQTQAKVSGSVGRTSNSSDPRNRVMAKVNAKPMAMAAPSCFVDSALEQC